MEKEAEQLKLNALNIKSVLTSGIKKLKKITYKKRNLDRIAGERKERRTREKILESSRKMANNIGSSVKNITGAVVGAVASSKGGLGKFLQLLLIGVAVNNIENIVKFFKGDTFKKLISGLKNIGKFFKNMFNGFIGFFKPKDEIKIPEGLNDDNVEKLNEISKELEKTKLETDKLSKFADSTKQKYDNVIPNNNSNNQVNTDKVNQLKLEQNQRNSFQKIGDLFTGAGQERKEQIQKLETGTEKRYGFFGEIKPVNKEVADLSMKKKTKTKTVFIRQPVIVGEK